METTLLDGDALLRSVFDALPFATLVVDEDVRVLAWNQAAEPLFQADRQPVYLQRGGDVLACLHARDVPGGCGRGPACGDCLVRNSVGEAFRSGKVSRRRVVLETRADAAASAAATAVPILLTAAPMTLSDRKVCILILEDVRELMELRALLPICAYCKKIRDDKNYWQSVESYIASHVPDVSFSHGMCPDCFQRQLQELERRRADGTLPAPPKR